jgi:conjugal transfer mating pair stabilization protein TraG
MLAFQLNPSLDPTAAQGVIDSQIEQAYYKTKIATAAQGAADLLRQNIMINLMQDTSSIVGQKINDPASIMIATARANATASINSSFLTMGKVAEQALPLVRNVIEAIIYAVFPFVFLLFLLAQGRGLGLALKSFVLSLVWIQLWPPLYAILNYVATLASAKNLEAAARMGASTQGLALETASSIYHGAISDQAVAGYMVISIPIIATAIIKGGEVAFQAVTGVGPMQSAVSGESSATSKGNVTQDSVSIDQQQLAPNRTSAFMSTTSNAHGSTIQGSGPDAGVFRYQATLSRLATTFTFSERQATSLSENARESETLARTERDSMQRSQSAALTNALGIQDSFDRSQQRSGASTTSDGGSTSTQLQKLNSVAREVNRRLGLGEESTVGKSVAASASTGAMIPLTQIGAQIRARGPTRRPATTPKHLRLRTQGRRDIAVVGSHGSGQGVPLVGCLPVGARQPNHGHFRLRLLVSRSGRSSIRQRERLWPVQGTHPGRAVHERVEQRCPDRFHQLCRAPAF